MDNKKKTERVSVYIAREDYNKLQSKLRLTGSTVSGWFRKIVKEFIN